jgi:hypothetical protein
MTERQTGATTRAIRAAPQNAVYICPPHAWLYTRALAGYLERSDLRIVGPWWLQSDNARTRQHPVVVDHAVRLTRYEQTLLAYIRSDVT